jgi:hypothetical protein
MDDNESLRNIAASLRQLARAGYGFPPAVRVKVESLIEIAARLEKIADAPAQGAFYGAECPSYPDCAGGCGLGCTKEVDRRRAESKIEQTISVQN